MSKVYDMIVIGAGNAGLMAAAVAARSGLSVLLLEKNETPGGSAQSFRRGRFEFEAALHELAAFGTENRLGSAGKVFKALGIHMDMCVIPDAFRVKAGTKDGYDVTLPADFNAFSEKIEELVPGSRDSFEKLFQCLDNVNAAMKYLGSGQSDPGILKDEYGDFLRMASCSVTECLSALGMPEKAQQIFCTYWPYLGAEPSDLDMLLYLYMLQYYLVVPPVFPILKSSGLSLALADSILKRGGEIRYGSPVTDILIENGTAVGVRVRGQAVFGKRILSTCFPDTVYSRMIPKEMVPARYRKIANARKPGHLFFCVYLGLNKSRQELGIRDYSVFLFNSPDPGEQAASLSDPMKSFIIVNCLNVLYEEASPEGTCMLYLTTMMTEEAWGSVGEAEYKSVKNRIADRMILTAEESLSLSIRPYIEEIAIAAPPSFARYLGTPDGTPYGYQLSLWDTMMPRTLNLQEEQYFKNLYFIGATQERGDGYSSAYSSGRTTAHRVIRELKEERKTAGKEDQHG